jgi:hypothetical protein
MKKVIVILIFLVAGYGIYHLYSSNDDLKKSINEYYDKYANKDADDRMSESEPERKGIKNKNAIKKKYKTLKPDQFSTLDEYAKNSPEKYEKDIPTLVEYLIKPANTELEKARVLFTWVATHIKYDDKAFNTELYPDYTPEFVLSEKKAVCEGYSNLFKALCNEAGLEAEKLIGYAKGYGYKIGDRFEKTDHAWNAIKIDNQWRLFDLTWASGFGTNKKGKLVSKSRFDPFWFNVSPKAFIFTHLPEHAKWQLIGNPITLEKYEKLPYLNSTFFETGFNPEEIFDEAITGRIKEFVEVYPTEFPLKVIKIPYTTFLVKNKATDFAISSDYAEEIALVEGDKWNYFKKENNRFSLTYIPTGKAVKISVKINSFDKSFYTLLKYQIIEREKITETNNI